MASVIRVRSYVEHIEKLTRIKLANVYRSELGPESLNTIKNDIENLVIRFKNVMSVVDNVSDELLDSISSTLVNFSNLLERMADYDNRQFVAYKSEFLREYYEVKDKILQWYPNIAGLIAALQYDQYSGSLGDQLEQLRRNYQENLNKLEDAKLNLESELDGFSTRYSEQIKKLELFKQEDLFETISKHHLDRSRWWLWAIIFFSTILSYSIYVFLSNVCFDSSCLTYMDINQYNKICSTCSEKVLNLEIARAIVYRILLISFIVFIIGFCVKNYNSCMHNYIVSNHKSNAMSAALKLIDRSQTPTGKDNLMNLAANAIFSHQPTGYNRRSPENIMSNVSEKIIDKMTP